MTTITLEQQQKIKELLNKIPMLSVGIGTAESACSVAAINLALSGELKDEIPECMSAIIGRWIIVIQDGMPADLRNSQRWRELLPLAAGTGRQREKERLDIVMNWMWETVLPQLQPVADTYGFGDAWRNMCVERTADAAYAAARAARAAHAARAIYAVVAVAVAVVVVRAARAAHAAYAALAVADAVYADASVEDNYWTAVDPCGMLEKLIGVTK
jgi:hypothetical protein